MLSFVDSWGKLRGVQTHSYWGSHIPHGDFLVAVFCAISDTSAYEGFCPWLRTQMVYLIYLSRRIGTRVCLSANGLLTWFLQRRWSLLNPSIIDAFSANLFVGLVGFHYRQS